MELINATKMVAGYTMGMEPSGRELLVVVVKGTFTIPRTPDEPVRLADEQLPLVMADTFTGAPGFSAPVYEVDFAPRKHRCDVLLLGSAYAPQGRPATRVPVGIRIGNWTKSFAAVGNRRWDAGLKGIRATPPEPFVTQPLSYDFAFGGVDAHHDNPARHSAFTRNPVGRGYHEQLKKEWLDGAPLPNTEELNKPVTQPDGNYAPMSLGAIGRSWEPRLRYAGTYDQKWLDDVFPFLPQDFDEQYYQAAPPDQQLSSAVRGEEVVLMNLTRDGRRTFKLPIQDVPVHIFPKRGEREELQGQIDTLLIEPDHGRFSVSWRTARPLERNIFEIEDVLIGRKSRAWWRARELGKTYYPSLAALVQEQRES